MGKSTKISGKRTAPFLPVSSRAGRQGSCRPANVLCSSCAESVFTCPFSSACFYFDYFLTSLEKCFSVFYTPIDANSMLVEDCIAGTQWTMYRR